MRVDTPVILTSLPFMAPMVAFQPLRMPLLIGGCTLAFLAPPVVHAHGIQSTLERLGRSTLSSPYQLESRFSTGLPARDAAVRMVSPTGDSSVELGHTNADGQLTFTLPSQARTDWEVQIDAGPGHRDYVELPGTVPGVLHSQTPSSRLLSLTRAAGSLSALALLGAMAGLMLYRPRP
jgi:nickel transport protein